MLWACEQASCMKSFNVGEALETPYLPSQSWYAHGTETGDGSEKSSRGRDDGECCMMASSKAISRFLQC